MELEDRYIVIKRKDFDNYLTQDERDEVTHAITQIDKARRTAGKRLISAVVVEDDWPEYEPTVKLIEERLTLENWHERNRVTEHLREYSRGAAEAMAEYYKTGKLSMVKGISAYAQGWNNTAKMSVAC
mgnify:CR=1 FL=1